MSLTLKELNPARLVDNTSANGTIYYNFLSRNAQLQDLISPKRVIIFTLADGAITSAGGSLGRIVRDKHIVLDFLGYKSDFVSGKA